MKWNKLNNFWERFNFEFGGCFEDFKSALHQRCLFNLSGQFLWHDNNPKGQKPLIGIMPISSPSSNAPQKNCKCGYTHRTRHPDR